MFRHNCKIRVSADGVLQIIDPAIEDLPFLQSIDPDYQIKASPLPGFTKPRFLTLRKWQVPLLRKELARVDRVNLKELHGYEMARVRKSNYIGTRIISNNYVTLLDVKIELARRELMECMLCGRRCGVNRLEGERGFCGLGMDAYLGGMFIHISEEAPINPSLLIELHGCGMRCRFCQKPELLEPHSSIVLDASIWRHLPTAGARSLSFIGGNPDESLFSILRFLKKAPEDFNLPIVWNCHGYGNNIVYHVLDGIVDVYIPDLKYGDDKCTAKWSGVKGYIETAQKCISEMAQQRVPVFVRILILPGHSGCCYLPSIRWLKELRDYVSVNIMAQYHPDFTITEADGPMADYPTPEEVQLVYNEVRKAGLKQI